MVMVVLLQVVGALDVTAGGQIVGLGTHVLDLGQLQSAVLLGLTENGAGDVGVDMDLEGVVAFTDDQTVAHTVEVGLEGLQAVEVAVLPDNEDGVKGEGDLLGGDGGIVGLLLTGGVSIRVGGHGLAPELVQHALEDHQKALAAGIHDAGFLENGGSDSRCPPGRCGLP